MLNRVAEALFWVGRYVERAEDTARLLDVHFHEVLEDPGVDEAGAYAVLLAVMGVPDDIARRHRDHRAVLELLGYDESTSVLIVGALVGAWQNARSAREALSAEIWESLNSTHNSLPGRAATAARDFGPAPFFSYVRERAAAFTGYVEAGMSRDASYDVLVLGRSLERVDMTARLLASRIGIGSRSDGWTSILRACSAQEAYLRTYRQNVTASRVLEFLLVDRLFPGRPSTPCGPGRTPWPDSIRGPDGPRWTSRPGGRSAAPAPIWSSSPPRTSSTTCRSGCSDCSGPSRR